MEHLIEGFKKFCTDILFQNVPKIVMALLILWIGWKLVNWGTKILKRGFDRKKMDVSLQSFLFSVITILLKVLLIITAAGMMGIQMTSFIAILGAAGLAVGMALQGTLQNFAGGVIILLLRPFRVGDEIEQNGITGIVKEIQIFNTVLRTYDNKIIIVPNTELATKTLTNYTKSENRRADINIGIAYGEDIEKARKVLIDMAMKHPCSFKDGDFAPVVVVADLGASSINLVLRVWGKTEDYFTLMSDLNQGAYDTLNENHIEIPFNQLQVHINQN